jgi:hypothetical protein
MPFRPFLGLTLAALLSAAPTLADDQAKAPPVGTEEPSVDEEFQNPPPDATAEDKAIWLAAQKVAFDIHASRSLAVTLQARANTGKLLQRLDAAAKGKPAEEAAGILSLRKRLKDTWAENYGRRNHRWPVDPIRGCGQALLLFDSGLRAKLAKAKNDGAANARADVKSCTSRSVQPIRAMVAANEAFAAAIDDAQKRLAELEPPAPPPAARAPGAAPGSAKAPGTGAR